MNILRAKTPEEVGVLAADLFEAAGHRHPAPGLRADFLICTEDLQLRQVWLAGEALS